MAGGFAKHCLQGLQRDVQWVQTGVCAIKHWSAPALTQAPQQEPPNSVQSGWAHITHPQRQACCMHAGSDLLLQHHSGQALPLSVVSSVRRRRALFECQSGGPPTPFPFLFLDVTTTTSLPTDSNPEPSLLHWAQRLTSLPGRGGSPPLPAAAVERLGRRGMLIAYTAD